MAELPSSNPVNRLSVGVQSPTINLAEYTPDPAKQQAALEAGFNSGQKFIDSIILRPKQIAAQQAMADYARAQAMSGEALVPAEQAARVQTLDTNNQINSTNQTTALQAQKDLTDPGWRIRAAHAQVVALTDDANQAAQAIVDAHASGDPKAVESAIKKKANVDRDLSTYDSRLKLLVANQTAAENTARQASAKAQVSAGIAEGMVPTIPQQVETAQIGAALQNTAANEVAVAASDFAARDARIQNLTLPSQIDAANNAVTAAGAGVVNPSVLQARQTGAEAGAVSNALVSQAQLAATVAQIATGQFTGTVSPQLEESIRTEAAKLGVPSIIPGTLTKRPLADVSQDYSKAININEAKVPLEKITADATTAAGQLENYQQLQQLIGTKVPTGYLYGLSAKAGLDQIAAQLGNTNAEIRGQIRSLQNTMIPDATRGLGRMTAPDIALFQQALVGPANTPQNNANIVAAEVASNQRDLDKQQFYTRLVGPLKINAVDTLWNQYIQSNPLFDHSASSPTVRALNKNMLTPDQYAKFITNSPQEAEAMAIALAKKTDVSTLPLGNTDAERVAAPATVPFLAKNKEEEGKTVVKAVPNSKFWAPVMVAASAVRASVNPSKSTVNQTAAGLMNTDPASYLRPATLTPTPVPPLERLNPR